VAEPKLRQEKRKINDQKDDASEIGARQKRGSKGIGAQVDSPRSKRRVAVWTYAVGDSDERPAVRAHSPFFHGPIVAGRQRRARKNEF
jgi:hypothetical protein